MRIKKRLQGHDIILDYKRVKKYKNGYALYDVYKQGVFLYRTCLTKLHIADMERTGYLVNDEEVFE